MLPAGIASRAPSVACPRGAQRRGRALLPGFGGRSRLVRCRGVLRTSTAAAQRHAAVDIEQFIANGRGRRTTDGRCSATKRALFAVSRSLEALAEQLAAGGDAFALLALFEDASYFEHERDRYTRLAAAGTVIVGFTGAGSEHRLPDGIHALDVAADDPLAEEWSVLVLSPAVTAGLVAVDLRTVVAARSLERGRLFGPAVSSDPSWVIEEAERILAGADAEVAATALELGRAAADRRPHRGEEILREELEAGWWRTLTIAADIEDSERRALTDALTGARDRRFLDRYLARIGGRAPQLAVVLFDLDGFGAVTDRFGHSVGETTLRAFTDTVRRHVRSTDLLIRYDTDQWLLLLPCTPLESVEERTAAILGAWGATRLPEPAHELHLAASAGVGVVPAAALDVAALDAAIATAKAAGGGTWTRLAASL
ncbi:MAG: diguanylate cyclase [Nitriliruptor sp.]|nr:MAG: diguanylate cyclase [Nitriliruptor sp.]